MKKLSLYENVPPQKNNFTVKFKEYLKQSSLLPHWHEHIELLYFLDGECELIINGERCSAAARDLVVVNSAEIHSFEARGRIRYYCTLIYPDFFADVGYGGVKIKRLIHADDFIGKCISHMHDESAKESTVGDMLLKSYTYRLMAYLVEGFCDDEPTDERRARDRGYLERLSLVAEHVKKNYTRKITTRELADMCYLTESHFCRFFKRLTGKSATEYVNDFRIERAAAMLADTDGQVCTVAEAVGFDDVNYFSRVFKRVKGASPTEYRKRQLNI